jgi:hypothetical protein
VPVKVLDLKQQAVIRDGATLVLSRPDQYGAWRGIALPADPFAMIDRVRGADQPERA